MATLRRTLKTAPRVARPLTGPGRLPKVENLVNKTPEELISLLGRFNINPDINAIDARAQRAFGKLERIIAEGIEPDAATWKSIEEAHNREMEQSLRRMAKQAIRLYRLSKLAQTSTDFMWVTVADAKVCPSCEPRHGVVKTMRQWQRIGLPGSAALVCNEECRCHLIPT